MTKTKKQLAGSRNRKKQLNMQKARAKLNDPFAIIAGIQQALDNVESLGERQTLANIQGLLAAQAEFPVDMQSSLASVDVQVEDGSGTPVDTSTTSSSH